MTGGSVKCDGTLGKKPWWMSWGQYDPCTCKLPAGHGGDHQCEHTDATLAIGTEPGDRESTWVTPEDRARDTYLVRDEPSQSGRIPNDQ